MTTLIQANVDRKVPMNAYLPLSVISLLEKRAGQLGVSRSEVIIEIVREALEEK